MCNRDKAAYFSNDDFSCHEKRFQEISTENNKL